jgi:hypothetical protein
MEPNIYPSFSGKLAKRMSNCVGQHRASGGTSKHQVIVGRSHFKGSFVSLHTLSAIP